MNAVRAALGTTEMSWRYWTLALADATDKYNQLPHGRTEMSPHQAWFNVKAPNLKNLYIFGQFGFVPVMNKQEKQQKYRNRGTLVLYLRRDEPDHGYMEHTDGTIKRY